MTNLTALPTLAVRVNAQVVETLEKMLVMARDGRIESFCAIAIRTDGGCSSFTPGSSDWLKVLGGLRVLEHDYMAMVRDEGSATKSPVVD